MIFLAICISLLITTTVLLTLKLIGPEGSLKKNTAIQNRIFSDGLNNDADDFSQSQTIMLQNNFSDIKSINKLLRSYEKNSDISESLRRSDLKISVSVFYIFSVLIFTITFTIVNFKLSSNVLSAMIGGVAAMSPFFYLRFKNKQYVNKFAELLPNALSLILNSIKVGQSLETGFHAVGKAKLHPVSTEFRRMQNKIQMGITMRDAVNELYQKIPIAEVKIFATGISIHQEFGGNLAESLEILEETIRDRFALKRDIKALSAQGVTSAWILICVPFVVGGLWTASDPKMITNWLDTAAGKIGLGYCIMMVSLAILLIRKIVDIKP